MRSSALAGSIRECGATITDPRLVFFGSDNRSILAKRTTTAIAGRPWSEATARAAAEALDEDLDPMEVDSRKCRVPQATGKRLAGPFYETGNRVVRDVRIPITLRVNGESITRETDTRKNLVDFLRDDLRLTGTNVGCEHGVCGACTVRLDDRTVRACLLLAVQADGCDVVTIEGLSATGEIADLQAEFVRLNALQCGYCTPGMLATAAELLKKKRIFSRDEIRDFISGNCCRCTGYHAIVDAIESVMNARVRGAAPILEASENPIGASLSRSRATRFVAGKGRYADNVTMPRMLYAAFFRSPHAHARIININTADAEKRPGVHRVLTGKDIVEVCKPYRALNSIFPNMKSPLQYAVPIEKVHYQGEPVAIVIADTRALAEDAAEHVAVEWEPLPAVTEPKTAGSPDTPLIHPELETNVVLQLQN